MLAETSAHYVATVEADASDKSNQAQRLEVRVTRAGVTTRSRPDLAPATARPAAGKPVTPQQMVREARAFTDLPLRAVGYASRGASGRMTVIALGESADPAAKITAAAVGLVDQAGKLVAQTTAGEKELAQVDDRHCDRCSARHLSPAVRRRGRDRARRRRRLSAGG